MAEKINNYNGIINVYKEKGFTSFDVVAKLRGICEQRKIGHTGTLDPDATGVLPVCLGNATKVCDLLTDHDKEYEARLLLGIATDTQDITGEMVGGTPEVNYDEEVIRRVIMSFVGDIEQVPPMYSALKVNGRKLCDLARKGIEVERKARPVTIHKIEIFDITSADEADKGLFGEHIDYISGKKLPVIRMRVHCSKGTYIRTLCDDIGSKLGCGGTMLTLERTKVGPFVLNGAMKLAEIQAVKEAGELAKLVMPADSLFADCVPMQVSPDAEKLLRNGNVLTKGQLIKMDADPVGENSVDIGDSKKANRVRVYFRDGTFAGLYCRVNGLYKPEKMFL